MSATNQNDTGRVVREETTSNWLGLVRDQLASLRFGAVQINVHDGRVVQLEKNEKLRLDRTSSTPTRTEQRG
jgi:hypothetical protein